MKNEIGINIKGGAHIERSSLGEYFKYLIGKFYKILPLREEGERTLPAYLDGLQAEMLGSKGVVPVLGHEPLVLTLIFKLGYLIDNPNSEIDIYKREVFGSISILNKLKTRYSEELDDEPVGSVSK